MSNHAEMRSQPAKAAARLRAGILIVFGLILFLYVAGRFGIRVGHAGVEFRSHPGSSAKPFFGDGIMLLLALAIYWLSAALQGIAQGGLFSRQIIRRFRLFALWLLVMALYSFLAPLFFAGAGLSRELPHRMLFAVDVKDLLLVGVTSVMFLITRLLERAGEIEQENREII